MPSTSEKEQRITSVTMSQSSELEFTEHLQVQFFASFLVPSLRWVQAFCVKFRISSKVNRLFSRSVERSEFSALLCSESAAAEIRQHQWQGFRWHTRGSCVSYDPARGVVQLCGACLHLHTAVYSTQYFGEFLCLISEFLATSRTNLPWMKWRGVDCLRCVSGTYANFWIRFIKWHLHNLINNTGCEKKSNRNYKLLSVIHRSM